MRQELQQVEIIKREEGKYFLKFPFLDIPVQTNRKFLESIRKDESYYVIERTNIEGVSN